MEKEFSSFKFSRDFHKIFGSFDAASYSTPTQVYSWKWDDDDDEVFVDGRQQQLKYQSEEKCESELDSINAIESWEFTWEKFITTRKSMQIEASPVLSKYDEFEFLMFSWINNLNHPRGEHRANRYNKTQKKVNWMKICLENCQEFSSHSHMCLLCLYQNELFFSCSNAIEKIEKIWSESGLSVDINQHQPSRL